MRLTQIQKESIDYWAGIGHSGRAIAKELGLSKSTVNDYLKRETAKQVAPAGAKILILDVETAAAVALAFSRFKVNLSQDHIVNEGGWILCASWAWFGDNQIHSVALTPDEIKNSDDSRIIRTLFELYEQADAIVAHNGCSFDHKVIQTRAVFNGLPPLPALKVLDTLLLAKRYLRLPSNRLDSIGEYFGLGRKIENGGISLWKRVQSGDEDAMEEMLQYCEQDVNLLYNVYNRLRHLGQAGTPFNAALYHLDDEVRCTICGSNELVETGRTVKTTLSTFKEYRCNSCGAVHRDRQSSTTKEKRKTLLTVT